MIWSISSIFSTSACTPDCSTALRAVSYSLLQLLHPLPNTLISIALLLTYLRSACSRKRHRPGRKRDQAGPADPLHLRLPHSQPHGLRHCTQGRRQDITNPVRDPDPLPAALHQTGVGEVAKETGRLRLAYAQQFLKLADTEFICGQQQAQHTQPGFISNRLIGGGQPASLVLGHGNGLGDHWHTSNIPV